MGSLVVVVSGLPASGKTTVGRLVADAFDLVFLDKDDVLESLFPSDRIVTPEERSVLSRRADELVRQAAEAADRLVIASHWLWPGYEDASGTSTDWFDRFAMCVEVHCECSPATAAHRYLNRRRHPSHRDDLKEPGDLIDSFGALSGRGPLGVGHHLVRVDTERRTDPNTLLAALAELLDLGD